MQEQVAIANGPTASTDEWARWVPAWHAAMAGLVVVTVSVLLVDDGLDSRSRLAALALMAALAAWYAISGRRALRGRGAWQSFAYLVAAVPLTIAVFGVAPAGGLMFTAMFPHIWMMVSTGRAIVVTALAIACAAAVTAARTSFDPSSVATVAVLAPLLLVATVLLGLWIDRIIRQSQQRAALVAELSGTREELAAVSRAAGVLAERERLAHEIHDTLAQGFASVLVLLEAVEAAIEADPAAARRHIGLARTTARENLAEARALVAALAPPDLTQVSLPEALRRLVERADAKEGLRATLLVTGTPLALPPEHEMTLLRAAQESLTNVRRHARASRVELQLAYAPEGVRMRVHDDGRGFDPAQAQQHGYGLAGMRSRVSQLGGTMHVRAAPGQGATICIDVRPA